MLWHHFLFLPIQRCAEVTGGVAESLGNAADPPRCRDWPMEKRALDIGRVVRADETDTVEAGVKHREAVVTAVWFRELIDHSRGWKRRGWSRHGATTSSPGALPFRTVITAGRRSITKYLLAKERFYSVLLYARSGWPSLSWDFQGKVPKKPRYISVCVFAEEHK